jgi:hypothetical protein
MVKGDAMKLATEALAIISYSSVQPHNKLSVKLAVSIDCLMDYGEPARLRRQCLRRHLGTASWRIRTRLATTYKQGSIPG